MRKKTVTTKRKMFVRMQAVMNLSLISILDA